MDRPRILIADDTESNQLVLYGYLLKMGFIVELVDDGLEAVELCSKKIFDLILLDINMPQMDGLQAAKIIRDTRNLNTDTPIIAISGYSKSEFTQEISDAGFNSFLMKPISRVDLMNAVTDEICKESEIKKKLERMKKSTLLFDEEIIKPIFDGLDEEATKTLIASFKNDIKKYVNMIKYDNHGMNITTVEEASHGIKGLAGIFGAIELYRLSEMVNTGCRGAPCDSLKNEVAELVETSRRVIESVDVLENHLLNKT